MKRRNKIPGNKKIKSESYLLNEFDDQIITENEEIHYSKRESIINDLKQKGFNELQIDDIFETFKRNSVSSRYPLIEENNLNNIFDSHTIDTDMHSSNKKNKMMVGINSNSKYKNSFVIKSENTKNQSIYKNKTNKHNCAKLYVNASSDKYRKNLFCHKEKKENKYKNNIKIKNIRKNNINPIINTNRIYSRKISQKEGNYPNKFKLSYRNSINSIEDRKNEMLKKYEYDDNYNNYNFKIIFETKKVRDRNNNIGYLDIKSIKTKNGRESHYKSRNKQIEENKNNLSNSINDSNNIFLYKKNIFRNKNDKIGFNLKEIKEEKENNNQFMEVKINRNNTLDRDNEINNKNNDVKYKRKFYNQMIKELKTVNEIKNINYKNKLDQKFFSYRNNHFNKKEKHTVTTNKLNQKNNILIIRKQNTEEEENLAKKNNSISIIKQNDNIDNKTFIESNIIKKNNFIKKIEKNIKSKSLSKISDRSISKNNHNFVNINLCKNKIKKCSTIYQNRGLSIRQNKKNLVEKYISDDEIISDKNETEKINNENYDKNKSFNSSFNDEENTNIRESINDKNNNKSNTITNIIRVNKIPNKKQNNPLSNNNQKLSNNTTNKNVVYNFITKKYPNGTYKGYICNDKREKSGIMFFDNGAKYEGQWKNDKKNGKGVFTSAHYFDCKNFVGMKYEGDFKDDKFEGYGITTYTNGDKYEGEWKNNKQYGRGVVTYFNGEKYEGEWKEGFFEGIGIFYLKNGERFEGRFKDNKYNGYGKYFYINGEWLEGIFKNDHPSGNCLLHKKDGTVVNVLH